MRVPVRARSLAELQAITSPVSVPDGQSEAIRYTFFDTQTYVAAGSAQLSFFQSVNADKTLSNMQSQGQFPDPQYFELWYISCDVLLPVSSAAVPAAWADMTSLIETGRPILELVISDKRYVQVPLTFCHASGGISGFGYSVAALAATAKEYANNGIFDGGYCVDGAIILPPKVGFTVNIRWGNPIAVAADTPIRVNLDGVLHRRVL